MMLKSLRVVLRNALISLVGLENHVRYGRSSFAQEGEDILLWRLMDHDHSIGTYVDVGCNHPFRMSNTAFFYQNGWSGVAIDPNPDFSQEFAKLRPRDHFFNCGVAEKAGLLTYSRFSEPLYNTFNEDKSNEVAEKYSKLVERVKVPVRRLDEILSEVWPSGRDISFLSVDCEGLDYEVLKSHNFRSYPVDFVCVEVESLNIDIATTDPSINYLKSLGFTFISKLGKSAILVSESAAIKWKLNLR
jgi:FkbM family methyltransferase